MMCCSFRVGVLDIESCSAQPGLKSMKPLLHGHESKIHTAFTL